MKDPIVKVVYNDIEITYLEETNKWNFILRGRERNAESLVKAKEWIDKPEPGKSKPFQPITGYLRARFGDEDFTKVNVTSIAEASSWNDHVYVWVVDLKGKRQKESANIVYEDSPQSEKLREEYSAMSREIQKLNNDRENLMKRMKTIEVKAE